MDVISDHRITFFLFISEFSMTIKFGGHYLIGNREVLAISNVNQNTILKRFLVLLLELKFS